MSVKGISIILLVSLIHQASMGENPPAQANKLATGPQAQLGSVDKKAPETQATVKTSPSPSTIPSSGKPAAVLPASTTQSTQKAQAAASAAASQKYEADNYYGVPVHNEKNQLLYVDEHKTQTHSKDNYVMVRVKGIKPREGAKETGRIRVAVWHDASTYAKEGVNPFRASSHWAKDTVNGEMVFKISGLEKGKSYSFFAHFDQNNVGKVERNFIGIPKYPFIFSNAANKGLGKGLTRDGLSAPKFEKTLVAYDKPGQEIILTF